VVKTAVSEFGSINHLVNNAGIFKSKPFTDYTSDELQSFVSINLGGFVFLTQLAVKQMLSQGNGGSVTTITAALADNPRAGSPASVPMITKGGLNAITISLAIEYAKDQIRFNAVAPGEVSSPLHADTPKEVLKAASPMGIVSEPKDIADAVVYLAEARYVTGRCCTWTAVRTSENGERKRFTAGGRGTPPSGTRHTTARCPDPVRPLR
jgi:NAD(P)-dependent dehydrogenase (short-subunit alcohol dehydrogenase family)